MPELWPGPESDQGRCFEQPYQEDCPFVWKIEEPLTEVKEEVSMSLTPLTHRVLIRPEKPEEAKRGSIILPAGDPDKKNCQGKIVELGPGRQKEDGSFVPMSVKKGDIVEIEISVNSNETKRRRKK